MADEKPILPPDATVSERRWPKMGVVAPLVLITLLLIVVTAALLYGLYLLSNLLFLIIISVFFAYLMDPLVRVIREPFAHPSRERFMPRSLAILIAYIIVFMTVGIAVANVAPRVAEQGKEFAASIPAYTTSAREKFNELSRRFQRLRLSDEVQDEVNKKVTDLSTDLGSSITAAVGGAVLSLVAFLPWFVLVPVLAFFFLKDVNLVRLAVLRMFPAGPYRIRAEAVMRDINLTLAAYTRAQLISCVWIGILCTIAFYLIGLKYALLLGILAGIFEFVPLLGPATIGIIVVLIAAFGEYPPRAWWVLIFLVALRIAQDYMIYPRIVRGGIHLHPLVIILAVLAGEQLAGIPGVFISIPVVAIVTVIYKHILDHHGSRSLISSLIEENTPTPAIEEEASA